MLRTDVKPRESGFIRSEVEEMRNEDRGERNFSEVAPHPMEFLPARSSILIREKKFFPPAEKIIASRFRGFYLARHPIGIAFALPDASELAHQVASWSNGSP
jgi:hypothetical protein